MSFMLQNLHPEHIRIIVQAKSKDFYFADSIGQEGSIDTSNEQNCGEEEFRDSYQHESNRQSKEGTFAC